MRFKTILVFFLLLATAYLSYAQTNIPFQMKGGLILFKLSIEGKSGTFVFDSGAATTVIDSATAAEHQIRITSSRNIPGATGSTQLNAVSNVKITLGDSLNLVVPSAVLVNLKPLEEILGAHFDGIIGYELLRRYRIKINYDQLLITLQDHLSEEELQGYSPLTFNFNNGITIPQFEISITLQNGASYNGQVFFDSGAAASLIINTPFKKTNQLDTKIGKTLISRSHDLHKETISEEARIKSVRIGPFILNDLTLSLSSAAAGVNAYDGYLGILGNTIIKRFNLIYDYGSKLIYMKPNDGFKKNFDFPMSGIQLRKVGEDIQIRSVVENTEAFRKGIKAGQILLQMDGYSGKDLDQYKEKLKQAGKTIRISLKNPDGSIQNIEIFLSPLV